MRIDSCTYCGGVSCWYCEGDESIERRYLKDSCKCNRRLVPSSRIRNVRREIDDGLLIVFDESEHWFWGIYV